jgi:hypothetical protein
MNNETPSVPKIKICSFDVGILNLAYCVLDTDNKISKWEIINVINRDKIVCGGMTKKTKNKESTVCGKKASYYGYLNQDTNNEVYYCGSHKSNHEPLEKDWETKIVSLYKSPDLKNRTKCTYMNSQKNTTCDKNATYTTTDTKDDHVCTLHKNSIIKAHLKLSQVQKIKKKSAATTSVRVLAENMCTKLDDIPDLLKVNRVLIENQPSLLNPTMKTVSAFLYSYFVTRGVVDKSKTHSSITDIEFKSPSNKLKIDSDDIIKILKSIDSTDPINKTVVSLIIKFSNFIKEDELKANLVNLILSYLMNKKETIDSITNNKFNKLLKEYNLTKLIFTDMLKKIEKDDKNYKITKLLSIKYTEILLKNSNQQEWLDHLDTHTKKDDLCDAFLQAYYCINK